MGGGGLALPNLHTYYWAAAFMALTGYIPLTLTHLHNGPRLMKPVVTQSPCPLFYAPLSPYCGIRCAKTNSSDTPLRFGPSSAGHTDLKISLCLAQFTLMFYSPSIHYSAFAPWHTVGLCSRSQLYVNNLFALFAQLQSRYHLPVKHHFRYLQVRN